MTRKIAILIFVGLLLGLAGWQLARAGLMAGKAFMAPILIGMAWDEAIEQGKPVLPWPWADSYPSVRIEVPELGVTRYVLAGDNMRNLAFGPVLADMTSASVLYGHRDTHFRFIKDLQNGQELLFQRAGESSARWRVAHNEVVEAEDLAVPSVGGEKPLLLVTCFPFDAIDPDTDLRYVVWLERIA